MEAKSRVTQSETEKASRKSVVDGGCDKVLVQCAYRVCNVSLYSPEPLLVPQRGPF